MISFSLAGKTAVVTGGARGLGRAIAAAFCDAGASLVLGDIDEAGAAATARDLSLRGRAIGVRLDVADQASTLAAMRTATETFGHPDIWVNNAGIDIIEPCLDIDLKNWRKILEVDLTGAFIGSQAFARSLIREKRTGAIINITSIAAAAAIRNLAAYGSAKAGLGQLTRTMAVELAPHGIRVNAIAPGYLENIMESAAAEHGNPEKQAQIETFTPLGRRARLEEVAGPAVFLASDAASYITGATLAVDGGYSAI